MKFDVKITSNTTLEFDLLPEHSAGVYLITINSIEVGGSFYALGIKSTCPKIGTGGLTSLDDGSSADLDIGTVSPEGKYSFILGEFSKLQVTAEFDQGDSTISLTVEKIK